MDQEKGRLSRPAKGTTQYIISRGQKQSQEKKKRNEYTQRVGHNPCRHHEGNAGALGGRASDTALHDIVEAARKAA